jgi:hypothetical protein
MRRIITAVLAAALLGAGFGAVLITPARADQGPVTGVVLTKHVARAADDACGPDATDQLELQGSGLVEYCYIIDNQGDTDVEIEALVDDKLGGITIADDELSVGEIQEIPFGEVPIDETTTNVATLIVNFINDAGAADREEITDSATVTVVETQNPDLPQVEPKFACTTNDGVRLFVTVTNPDPDTSATVDIEIGSTVIAEAVVVPAGGTVTRDFPETVAQLGEEIHIVGTGSDLVFDGANLVGLPRPACAVPGDPDFTG